MRKIIFILKVGREFGVSYGHFYRSLSIAQNKQLRSYEKIFVTNKNLLIKKLLFKKNIRNIQIKNFNLTNIKKTVKKKFANIVFVDLPKEYMSIYSKLKFKNQVLLSDSEKKRKNYDFLINYSILLKENKNNNEFLGLKYFFKKSNSRIRLKNRIKNIFVSFGGSDFHNYGLQIAKFIHDLDLNEFKFTINFGPGFIKKKFHEIKDKFKRKNIEFFYDNRDYDKYLLNSDLVITGGGITAYKIANSLKPLLIIPGSKHENKIANKMHQTKSAILLKASNNRLDKNYFKLILNNINKKYYFRKMLMCQKKLFSPNKFNLAIKMIKNF